MLSYDGERSKKRKWFAEKQIKIIKEIDVPGKVLKWDDFTLRVWQHDGLSGGRITAPMGAVAMCSNGTDIKISIADYWAGGFSTLASMYSLYYRADGDNAFVKVLDAPSEEDAIADGNSTFEFKTATTKSPFGLDDGFTIGPDTVWVDDFRSQPGIMPFMGSEYFWTTLNDRVRVDIDGDGYSDFPKYIMDSNLNFYISDGNSLGGRRCSSLQVGGGYPESRWGISWHVVQQVSPTKQISHQNFEYENHGGLISGHRFEFPSHDFIYLSEIIPAGVMPDELRTILLKTYGIVASWPLGNYSCHMSGHEVYVHINNATNTNPWTAGSPSEAYFNSNPSEEKWKLSLSWMVDGVATLISSDQFIDLLDSVATVEIKLSSGNIHWKNARRMAEQLFPYPNCNWSAPYDSVMFHDANYVYTWTRKYGGFKFSNIGITAKTINVPSWEEGTRPDIYYSGKFDEVDLFLCVSNKVKEGIKGVYYGSPFTSWTQLPHIEGLYHVRPVVVSPDNIFLIGIVKDTIEEDGIEKIVYYFASFVGDEWRKMGRLPFEVGEDNLQVGLFGNDKRVDSMSEFQLPVCPQIPVGPYDKYAIGLP